MDLLVRLRAAAAEGTAPTRSLDLGVERLFARHQQRVFRVCLRFSGDPETARELAQEALLVAFRKLPEFEGQARFGTWLYGIARNLCLNRLRKKGELLSEDGIVEVGDPGVSALTALTRQERETLVREAAASLTDEEQEAVHLRYVEGLPRECIEGLLGLGDGQARVVLQRCKRHLQREVRARLAAMGHGSSFLRTRG
ncbi:MAG: sigma-70 family RNA polymerase sigma factor [Pseudomonadota bacterium]